MNPFNKSLHQLWTEAGEKPFTAEHAGQTKVLVIAKRRDGFFIGEHLDEAIDVEPDTKLWPDIECWRLYVEEPKAVPHYRAIYFNGVQYFMKDWLFEAGTHDYAASFVRLATEWPPIMLAPK